jgi:hypothetical protein
MEGQMIEMGVGHPGGMLEVTFVRRRGSRDHVYVARGDGSSIGWDFPSYGDGLPHDLCHLVVEDELALTDGFWGLVDRGVEVGLVDNQATLMRNGKPLVEEVGVDLSGLVQAEGAVAVLAGPAVAIELAGDLAVARLASRPHASHVTGDVAAALGFELPASATPDALAAIRARLHELADRWRTLEDGAGITLGFERRPR